MGTVKSTIDTIKKRKSMLDEIFESTKVPVQPKAPLTPVVSNTKPIKPIK